MTSEPVVSTESFVTSFLSPWIDILKTSWMWIVGVIILAILFRTVMKKTKPTKTKKKDSEYFYDKKPCLLSNNEAQFYKTSLLPAARAKGLTVFAMVRIGDLIKARKGSGGGRSAFNKISQKHVDFVLCDANLKPVMAVELDDSSHDRPDRVERDAFVDHAMDSAGLPILHTRDGKDLPRKIDEKLTPKVPTKR